MVSDKRSACRALKKLMKKRNNKIASKVVKVKETLYQSKNLNAQLMDSLYMQQRNMQNLLKKI